MNSLWIPWIVGSLTKYVNDNKGTLSLHIEGSERPIQDLIELRFIGPNIEEVGHKKYEIIVGINILLQSVISPTDLYKFEKQLGQLAIILKPSLVINKNGIEFWLCAERISSVNIQRFGQLNVNVKTLLASLEATYKLDVEE